MIGVRREWEGKRQRRRLHRSVRHKRSENVRKGTTVLIRDPIAPLSRTLPHRDVSAMIATLSRNFCAFVTYLGLPCTCRSLYKFSIKRDIARFLSKKNYTGENNDSNTIAGYYARYSTPKFCSGLDRTGWTFNCTFGCGGG